jgi:hypothetical protein
MHEFLYPTGTGWWFCSSACRDELPIDPADSPMPLEQFEAEEPSVAVSLPFSFELAHHGLQHLIVGDE